jgi:predicted AlkP superfamily phosphohydrolase/phosphomutase
MPAFALPAFYDGRVRVNLEGREAHGIVPRSEYDEVLRRIGVILEECTEPIGATSPVESIERFHGAPEELPDSCADLTVVWRNTPIGLDHPRLGRIGPLPWRRTGGHTGGHGFLYLSGAGLEATDFGIASSFDVVPTIVELSGNVVPPRISGKSLLPQIR